MSKAVDRPSPPERRISLNLPFVSLAVPKPRIGALSIDVIGTWRQAPVYRATGQEVRRHRARKREQLGPQTSFQSSPDA